MKRISGDGFLRFSGIGRGSFGLRRSFLVITAFTSIESENIEPKNHYCLSKEVQNDSYTIMYYLLTHLCSH